MNLRGKKNINNPCNNNVIHRCTNLHYIATRTSPSEKIIIDNSGHEMNVDNPDELAKVTDQFWKYK